MILSTLCLLIGAAVSFFLALAYIGMAIKPNGNNLVRVEQLAALREKGSPFAIWINIGIVLLFLLCGAYALSGAGLFFSLPMLKGVLIAIGGIFLLRTLILPIEIYKILSSNYSRRSFIFTVGSVVLGLLYLIGGIFL